MLCEIGWYTYKCIARGRRSAMCRRFFSDRALFEQAATSRSVTDFLVRLTTGVSVLVEIKGEEDERDRAKHQAARRWISAVNHWGREGQWEFVVCRDPQQLGNMLARLAAPAQSA